MRCDKVYGLSIEEAIKSIKVQKPIQGEMNEVHYNLGDLKYDIDVPRAPPGFAAASTLACTQGEPWQQGKGGRQPVERHAAQA